MAWKPNPKNPKAWSPGDCAKLIRLRERDKLEFSEIKQYFPGRTANKCSRKYRALRCPEQPKPERAVIPETLQRVEVSDRAITEREERWRGYMARDLTATFCGDPPRGFSALDRQRQAA